MRPRVLLAVLAAAILAGAAGYLAFRPAPPVTSFEECVAAGNPVMESFPPQCRANGQTFVQGVTTTPSGEPLVSENGSIRVTNPQPGATIALPLLATGEARAFEGNVQWRLLDGDGTELASGFTTTVGGEVGQFGAFSIRASYPAPRGTQGTLEIFTTSAQDGSVEGIVRVPVLFPAGKTRSVQAFFGSATRDPQSLRCDVAYPVTRRVMQTAAPARAALEELLAGPTPLESNQGFRTSLPADARILSLAITDGTARVDLGGSFSSGGSCRVSAIRAQVTQTLRQFPTVQRVEILVNGDPDGLEP